MVDTDAEGRLCLADSLVYAESLGVEAVVDIATLTGATLTALGEGIGGLYSPNERMARSVAQAAQDAGMLQSANGSRIDESEASATCGTGVTCLHHNICFLV